MGGFLNQITQPLGVKLFSGGPYADGGASDRMEGVANQGQANAEKFMAQLAPIIAQIAEQAGVVNPLQPGATGQTGQDPYGLSPLQQASLNQEQGITADAYDSIMSKVKANLSARGLGNSGAVTAAEAYLQKQMQSQLGQERVQAGQNAYANKQNALGQIGQLLGTGYGAQQGALGQQQNVLESQKQTALASHSDAMKQLGSLLSLGLYSGGVGPFGSKKAPGTLPGQGGSVPSGFYQGTGEDYSPIPPITLSGGFPSIYGR